MVAQEDTKTATLERARTRLLIGGAVFTVCFLVVGRRLVDLGVFEQEQDAGALHARAVAGPIEIKRADIVDRRGELLATNLVTASLYADPRQVPDPSKAARDLARLLPELSEAELRAKLSSERTFVWLKRNMTPRQQFEINRLGIPGLDFRREERRIYPLGPLTAHAVGFTGVDNSGLAGIEKSFDATLAAGSEPLQLSLDLRVQYILRKTLSAQIEKFSALGGGGVIMDVETGERSRRGGYVAELLKGLTGSENALIVNNNAAGLILALAATSSGKAVPVARGELIESGGSYRLPDVMAVSGCNLVEVGTTNRSRIGDFETAAQIHQIGALLKIHPSNYRIEGFTEQTSVAELAELAHSKDVPLIYDIGSGLLDAEMPWLDGPVPEWSRDEPAARQALEAGADLVTFSGDKLLGGPQAGIIVGAQDAVATLRNHPLTRALRVDAVTLAALTETLTSYAAHDVAEIPFWAQAALGLEAIEARAMVVSGPLDAAVVPGQSTIGAGSVPGMTLPTSLVVLNGRDDLFDSLLGADTPILARREGGNLVIDLRTVDSEDDQKLIDTVLQCR